MLRDAAMAALLLALCACVSTPGARAPAAEAEPDEAARGDPMLAAANVPHRVVREAFVTAATPADNIDSPAAWMAPSGDVWLLATAKEGKGLVVYDGQTGATLREVGTPGSMPGQFLRANGVFVHGDLAFVVERDNRRVQVLALPSFETRAVFGSDHLRQPYGLWLRERAPGDIELLVTDAYMAGEDADGDEIPPPLAQLDRRVHRFDVRVDGARVSATHAGTFGDTTAAGAIRVPESLWGDPRHDRLLISEEDIPTGTALREYDLQGRFRGRTVGLGLFKAQAEGIALWACADGSGVWIATDQFKDRTLFHLFDRVTLAHLGAFAGEAVGNTDGIWLQQRGSARFPAGAFYAVHDDQAVGAFDWRDIARATGVRATCDAR
ncbi:phytase [Tolypothrix campylonemoides VB511288]|nr:phytase [Tolypothrix campylonemoides VB511288]